MLVRKRTFKKRGGGNPRERKVWNPAVQDRGRSKPPSDPRVQSMESSAVEESTMISRYYTWISKRIDKII